MRKTKGTRVSARKVDRSSRRDRPDRIAPSDPSDRSGSSDRSKLEALTQGIRLDIWPDERQVLFKPERLRYVRKLVKPKGCVFCEAVKKGPGAKSLLLYRGEHAIVVLNKFPYNNGHALILPRRHCGDFLELTAEEHLEIRQCLRRTLKGLQKTYDPSGFNIGLNLGSAAGAGIPEHLHYHVIPRWSGDTNFFPLIANTKVVVETLESTFERLRPFFKSL